MEEPKYEINFSQTVSADDVYGGGGFSGKYNGSECCENLILKIYLTKEVSMNNFILNCDTDSISLKTKYYYLNTMLPKPIHSNQSTAKWISDKKILKLKLKVDRDTIDTF